MSSPGPGVDERKTSEIPPPGYAELTAEQKLQQCIEECDYLRMRIQQEHKQHSTILREKAADATKIERVDLKERVTLRGHFGKIHALHRPLSNNKDIVSASQDGQLVVWNALTTNKKYAIPLRSAWVMTCAYSPEGKSIACGGLDNLCSIFNVSADSVGWDDKQPDYTLSSHEGYISCCRFLDENRIITTSGDSTVLLWDIEKRAVLRRFPDHQGDVMSVDIYPQRSIFVTGSTDASTRVWDLRSDEHHACQAVFCCHESDVNCVKFFPDGNAFVSGSDDASCALVDLRANRKLNEFASTEDAGGVTAVDFSKSGYFLFAGYDDEPFCVCWHTLEGTDVCTLPHGGHVSCLQTSADGYSVTTGCWDLVLRIWA